MTVGDAGAIHSEKTPQEQHNGYAVSNEDDDDDEHTHLVIDEKNVTENPTGVHLNQLPVSYPYFLTPAKPSTSTGRNSCSPQSTLSNEEALSLDNSTNDLVAMKGKKSKIPAKRKSDGKILPIDKDTSFYECPQCKTILTSQHELTTHLRSHNGLNNSRSDHECHQCHKILSSSSSLDRHMLTHSGEKPFSCTICNQSFTTNGNMHRHTRTHEKKNETKRTFLKPKQKAPSKTEVYEVTNAGSLNYPVINKHILSEKMGNDTYSVDPQLPSQWTHPSFQDANKKHKINSSEHKPNLIISPTQDAPHDLSQKNIHNFPTLQDKDMINTDYMQSFQASPRSSPMDFAAVDFSSDKYPLICVAEAKRNLNCEKNSQHEYSCDRCSSTFPCKKALEIHHQSHFTDQQTSCQICDVTFNSSADFNNHNLIFHLEKDKECQRTFMNCLNLTSSCSKPSASPYSEIGTGETQSVKRRRMSEGQLPALDSPQLSREEAANIKVYKDLSLMPEQDRNHEDDTLNSDLQDKTGATVDKKKSNYMCTYCNKGFLNTRAQKSHERSHLGLAPYKCKFCDYSSPDKSTLIRHMRTHNGERPYQCKLCKYPFTTKANCERHVKKKHHILKKEELEAKVCYDKESSKEVENGDDSFSSPDTVCKYCNIDFKYFRHLKHHLRRHRSSEEKPFRCKQCHMGFSTKANCMRHIQHKHTEIDHVNIENFIIIQEPVLSKLQGSTASPRCMSAPPAAHSPVVHLNNDNWSMMNNDADIKPLDLRSSKHQSQNSSPTTSNNNSPICDEEINDQPIDLSIKKTKKASRKIPRAPDPSTQCALCGCEFKRDIDRQFHISQDHKDTQFQFLPQQQVIAGGNTQKYLQPSPMMQLEVKQEPNRLSPVSNLDCDSGDLASVNQILNTTGANPFEAFFPNHNEEDNIPTVVNGHEHLSNSSDYSSELTQKIKEEPQDPEECDDLNISMTQEECSSNSSTDVKESNHQETENDPKQKSQKKKRNSYADSPHKLKCPYCPRNFPWTSSLKRHILTHTGEKPFECPKCHVIFSTKSNRERHLTRKHGVNMLDPAARQTMDRPYKCHLCVFSSFATKENLLRHYRERHADVPLPEVLYYDPEDKPTSASSSPGEQQSSRDNNLNGMEVISPTSEDNDDGEKCNGSESLLNTSESSNVNSTNPMADNEREEEEEEEGKEEEEEEEEEDEEINNNRSHWSQTSAELQTNPIKDNYAVDKITNCWKCGMKFNARRLLQRHLKDHGIDLPFKCYLCDASFNERSECLIHKEKLHNSDWQILANKNKVDNIDLFSEKMDGIVGQKCDEFIHKMTNKIKNDNHMTDYLNRKVYCSLCAKRFWSLQDLRRHMRSHTGERPFECRQCGKRFTLKHSMMRHSKKHQAGGDGSSPIDSDDDDDDEDNDDYLQTNHLIDEKQKMFKSQVTEDDRKKVPMAMKMTSYKADQDDGESRSNILTDMLGMDESSIEQMLDKATSGARVSYPFIK